MSKKFKKGKRITAKDYKLNLNFYFYLGFYSNCLKWQRKETRECIYQQIEAISLGYV
jgi:hypothetical protein